MNTNRNILLLSIMLVAGCASTAPASKSAESLQRTEDLLNSPLADELRQEYPTLYEDSQDALADANSALARGHEDEAELYNTIAKSKFESARNLSLANEYRTRRDAMLTAAGSQSGRIRRDTQENALVRRYQQLDQEFNDATSQLERYTGEDQEARKVLARARKRQGEAINEGATDKATDDYKQGQTYIESSLEQLKQGNTKDALELAKRSDAAFVDAIANSKAVKKTQPRLSETITDSSEEFAFVGPPQITKEGDEQTTIIVNTDKFDETKTVAPAPTKQTEKVIVQRKQDDINPGVIVTENHITVDLKNEKDTTKKSSMSNKEADELVVHVPPPPKKGTKEEKEAAKKAAEAAIALKATVKSPEFQAPTYQKPEYAAPSYQKPEYAAPTYQKPDYAAPTYQKPEYAAPTYQKPEYAAPTYQKPDYAAPTYQGPEYAAPTYQKPNYQAPSYEKPEYRAPVYQPPEYKAPIYEAPTYRGGGGEGGGSSQPIIINQPPQQPIIIPPQMPMAPIQQAPPQPIVVPVPQPIVIQAPAPPPAPAPVVYPPYPPQPAYPPQPPVIVQAPAPAPAPVAQSPTVIPIPIPQGGGSQSIVVPGAAAPAAQPVVLPQVGMSGIGAGGFATIGQTKGPQVPLAAVNGTRDRVLNRMSDVQLKRAELLGRGDENICPKQFNEFDAILQIAEKRFDSGDYLVALEYLTRAEERLRKCQEVIDRDDLADAFGVAGATQVKTPPAPEPPKPPAKPLSTMEILGLSKVVAAQKQRALAAPAPAPQPVTTQQQPAQVAAPAPAIVPVANNDDADIPQQRPPMAPIDALYVPDDDQELPPPLVTGDYLTQMMRSEAIKAISGADRFVAKSVRRRKTNRTRLRAAIMMLQRARTEYYREDYISAAMSADKAKRIVATQAQLSALPEALIGPALPPAINPLDNLPQTPAPTVPATVNPNPPSPYLLPRTGAAPVPEQSIVVNEDFVIVDPPTEACKGNAALIDTVNKKQREVKTPPTLRELINAANDLNKAEQCKEAAGFYQKALAALYEAGAKPEVIAGSNSEELKKEATVALAEAEEKKAANSRFAEDPSFQVGVRLLSNANDSFRNNDFQNSLIFAKQASGSFDGVDKSGKPPKDLSAPGDASQYRTEYNQVLDALVARDRARDRVGKEKNPAYDRGLDFLGKARRAWAAKDYQAAGKLAVEAKKEFDSVQKPAPKPDNSAELAKQEAAKKLEAQKRSALEALEKARQSRRDCEAQSCRSRDDRGYLDAVGKVVDAETALATEQFDKTLDSANEAIAKFKAILAQPVPVEPDSPYLSLSGDQLILRPRVTFDSGADSITADAVPALDAAAKFFKKFSNRILSINIAGYTDSRGNAAKNQALSSERANAVMQALKARGVNIKIEAVGYGENNPIASNKTADGREKNRRVEIRFQVQD